jgi:DNA polymerase III epsilon subunit-like protein
MDAAELPQDLVFVDLETTGGNAAYHRITEVGIVRMQDGNSSRNGIPGQSRMSHTCLHRSFYGHHR